MCSSKLILSKPVEQFVTSMPTTNHQFESQGCATMADRADGVVTVCRVLHIGISGLDVDPMESRLISQMSMLIHKCPFMDSYRVG